MVGVADTKTDTAAQFLGPGHCLLVLLYHSSLIMHMHWCTVTGGAPLLHTTAVRAEWLVGAALTQKLILENNYYLLVVLVLELVHIFWPCRMVAVAALTRKLRAPVHNC